MRGGYQALNLNGFTFTSGTAQTVIGAYSAINNKKATLVSGLVVGDSVYPDFYAAFFGNETSITIGGDTIEISVTSADSVTVTVTEPETEPDTPTDGDDSETESNG